MQGIIDHLKYVASVQTTGDWVCLGFVLAFIVISIIVLFKPIK